MRKTFLSLICIIVIILFVTGCNSNIRKEKSKPQDVAFNEAKKISTEQGILFYLLKVKMF